tara:strand:- start:227 stop:2149 length:1923 start_codon:yes stop_codon:yes gene_type:complete
MPYFDEAPAKFGETKEKNTIRLEDNSTDNRNVDERLLRLKMKQLVQKEFFHQLEPVEVIEIEEGDGGNKFGNIIGRYIYSEYNISKGDARSNGIFKPINSNILQMPLPGELVVGLEFNDERYYFSALNPSTEIINNNKQTINQSVSDDENNTTPVEQQTDFANVSNGVKGVQSINKFQTPNAQHYKETNSRRPIVSNFEPGDTLIQGRHNNYIHLSSNQSKRLQRVGNDTNVRNDSGNIKIGTHKLSEKKGSIIHLTTNEQPNYDLSFVGIADLMDKSFDGKTKIKTKAPFNSSFTRPSILMQSDRIALYSTSDDIAIFSNQGNVHIKGTKVQIKNSRQVSLSANEVVNETKKLYRLKEDLASGNVLLLPEGIVERGSKLARDHRQNILNYINQLDSLIPAVIPGTNGVVNPVWFNNIRKKIKAAKEALQTNKLIVSLKWLDFDTLKTYTIDELREAFNPIPGMADVIGKLSNLKSLVEEVDNLKQDFEVAKAQFEEFKAIAQNPADYFENLILAKVETLTFDDFIEINATINDFETAGGDLNQIEGGQELKKESKELLAENEALQGLTGDERQTQKELLEEKNKSFLNKLKSGLGRGFSIAIVNKEIDVSQKETTVSAAESLSSAAQASEDAQKNLENT